MHLSPFTSPTARHPLRSDAYHQVGTQTAISGASPHQLVTLLFDGYFAALNRARGALQHGDVAAMGVAISHAVRIVDEGLRASLDTARGGSLAMDMQDLYAYVGLRLTQANLHADAEALDECVRLMQPLREAWVAIGSQVSQAVRT